MFGIRAYAGRVVTPDDDRKGASPVAVISYRAWRETFGADPSVVGGAFHHQQSSVHYCWRGAARLLWRPPDQSAGILDSDRGRTAH